MEVGDAGTQSWERVITQQVYSFHRILHSQPFT